MTAGTAYILNTETISMTLPSLWGSWRAPWLHWDLAWQHVCTGNSSSTLYTAAGSWTDNVSW